MFCVPSKLIGQHANTKGYYLEKVALGREVVLHEAMRMELTLL